MQSFVRSAGILMIVTIFLTGCAIFGEPSGAGSGIVQTPITESPSGETYPGKFIWHDLITSDPQSAGTFYEELFGWQIDYQGDYAVVRNGDKLIAGILKVEPATGEDRKGVWLPSVSVADVNAAATRVKENGGTILKGPIDMGQRGRAILISDPQRADIVLLSAKNGDPADTETAIGDWLWDEIWTNDPKSTEAFYTAVLGYDYTASSEGYNVFIHQEKWRAGIRLVADNSTNRLWVPVVRVADPEATTQRVEKLGGIVWISPDNAPNRGNTALIADPTGALLLIQRWPSPLSKGEQ